MNEDERSRTEKGESQPSKPQTGSGTSADLTFEAAENVVRRSHRQLQPPPGTRPADSRSRLARIQKASQSADLKAWAYQNSFLLGPEHFTQRWQSQGRVSGQECDVYYDESSGRYHKRNNTVAYEDWIQFFESIRIHNFLFIDTSYSLMGFMEVERQLHAVLSQRAVNSTRGATRSEVENYMSKFDFWHVGDDHYESESVLIQDLHDENVLVGDDGLLYFIDTCIYIKQGENVHIGWE